MSVVDVKSNVVPTPEWGFDEEAEARILTQVRELRPLLQQNAAATEAQRTPTREVIAALDAIDAWSVAIPKRLGGHGVGARGLARISAEMAKGDPSIAWVSQIINGTTWVTTLASDELQAEIFGNGVPKISGVFNPPGNAIAVAGGYRVSGRWPYASGCRQAKWGQWGIKIAHSDGSCVPGNFCYIPMAELRIEDTWHVPGMQGTGSDTVIAEDIFVPERRVVHAAKSYNYVEPGKVRYGAPSDYFAQISFVHRTSAGVLLGAAEGLLETVCEAAKVKPMVGTTLVRQIDSGAVVRDLGEAAAKLITARSLIEGAAHELDLAALERRVMSELERARNKLQASYAVQIMDEAVQSLMFVAGSGAFNYSSPASRYWRDFNVASRHFAYIPVVAFEAYGRSLLGVAPNIVPPHML
jgi:alkylation response protein AidB-like acyl-CoA dehydrogenase